MANWVKLMKELHSELMAYRAVYEAVDRSGRFPDLVLFLEAAKSAARLGMDERYDPVVETLLKAPTQEALDQALRELLLKAEPKGPVQ